jgi:hypothetical protein
MILKSPISTHGPVRIVRRSCSSSKKDAFSESHDGPYNPDSDRDREGANGTKRTVHTVSSQATKIPPLV